MEVKRKGHVGGNTSLFTKNRKSQRETRRRRVPARDAMIKWERTTSAQLYGLLRLGRRCGTNVSRVHEDIRLKGIKNRNKFNLARSHPMLRGHIADFWVAECRANDAYATNANVHEKIEEISDSIAGNDRLTRHVCFMFPEKIKNLEITCCK